MRLQAWRDLDGRTMGVHSYPSTLLPPRVELAYCASEIYKNVIAHPPSAEISSVRRLPTQKNKVTN